jgi:predicted nucleotidyltransferase
VAKLKNDLIDEEWLKVIRQWSSTKGNIRRAWVFGGRIKGTSNQESDIDIALDFDTDPYDSNPDATWLRYRDDWRRELAHLLPIPVDLRHWHPDGINKVINGAVSEHGRLVFDRSTLLEPS